MSETVLMGVAIGGLIVGVIALFFGVAAFVLAMAMKMSTHQVTWRSLDENKEDPFEEDLPRFEDEPVSGRNPNKRARPESADEDLEDLDDPRVTSNNW